MPHSEQAAETRNLPIATITYIDARGVRQVAQVRLLAGETVGQAGQRFARQVNGTFITALDPSGNTLDANTSQERLTQLLQRQTDLLAQGVGETDVAGGVTREDLIGPEAMDGGIGGGTEPEQLPFDFEGAFPGAAFRRGLETRTGRTGQATNILQRILQSEAPQTVSAFRGGAIADLLGGAGLGDVLGRSFEDFSAGTGRVARSNLAQDVFRRIGGATGGIENFLGNEAIGDRPGEFLRPTSSRSAGDAINLLRDALRGTVNPLLQGALPNNEMLFDEFRQGVGINPTGGSNIIDFLRKRFRTSQLGF